MLSDYTWTGNPDGNRVYLTFDDGPIPEVTPWVLDQLDRHDARGTFFCVGDNVRRNSILFDEVLDRGHSVGNHTFHHLNGWSSDRETYLKDVHRCGQLVPGTLFRPPYGKLRPGQVTELRQNHEIVLWDILSGDFDPGVDGATCVNNVLDNVEAGSIIVFHDSLKSAATLRYALPIVLRELSAAGFTLDALDPHALLVEEPEEALALSVPA